MTPIPLNERVRKSKNRKEACGLINYKIDVHPADITAVRKYAEKQPSTKHALKLFKESKND